MAKVKSVKDELFKDLAKDKGVKIGIQGNVPYFVNTGHYGLNWVLSGKWLGGWAAETVSELFGDPSSGKSLILDRAMASVQRKEIYPNEENDHGVDLTDTFVILDDTEGARKSTWFAKQLLNKDDIIELDSTITIEKHFTEMEDKVNQIRKLAKKAPIMVCCDSISQLSTEHEMETGMEKVDMQKAKKVHQAMRVYSDFIEKNGLVYLLASHVIDNMSQWGPKKRVKGGAGLAFQSTVRVDLTYLEKFVRNVLETEEAGKRGEVFGARVLATAIKNRMFSPFKFTVMDIYFESGLDPYSGLFDLFLRQGKIKEGEKKGVYELGDKMKFMRDEFEDLVIEKDLLGVKKAGYEYMPKIDKEATVVMESFEEEEGKKRIPMGE